MGNHLSAPSVASGIPRGDHWIRIASDYLETIDGFDDMLERASLSSIRQEDGYMIVHGAKEAVSSLLADLRRVEKGKAEGREKA